jgi:TonB family protein
MKRFLILVTILLLSAVGFGQGNFKVVQQQQAHYPKGDTALQIYFDNHISYPQAALDKRVYGNVMISLDVSADSTLSNIIVLKGVGYGLDEEVVRVLKPLKFAPAIANTVAIRSNIIISIYVKAIPKQ